MTRGPLPAYQEYGFCGCEAGFLGELEPRSGVAFSCREGNFPLPLASTIRIECFRGRPRRTAVALLAILLVVQAGCASSKWQNPSWNKPVGKGSVIPALICGALGAGIGVAIQNQRSGSSTVILDGETFREDDDKDLWKGAVIGAPIAMVVCGILGHVFLDPGPEAPLPPPPPPTPEPTPPVKRRIVLRGVNFDFDSAAIRPGGRPVLDHAAEILFEQAQVRVLVAGHTDSVGADDYNMKLSIRRAEAVYRYLVNRGIDPERMRVEGYGESNPVASNETDAGRAQNRRVELQIQQ